MRIHFDATQQFTATGRYTDGSSQELTSHVTWTTLAAGIATVSDAGLVSTLAVGGTTVIAASGGISGTTLLTIVGKVTLPKTGQNLCNDVSGVAIPCTDTGQDGEVQKGMTWPEPRFRVDGTSSCITDSLTGLTWARNANLLANSAATPPDTGQRTWQQALNYANHLQLCGYTDWRLPNRREVPRLINFGSLKSSEWLTAQGFTNVQSLYYWTSSSYAFSGNAAWIVSVEDGVVAIAGKYLAYAYVWPVRGGSSTVANLPVTGQLACYDVTGNSIGTVSCINSGQDGELKFGITWPTPRFILDNSGNCITDNLTGLMWVRAPSTLSYTWASALRKAKGLILCGYSEWRLPNVYELESLVNSEPAVPAVWLNSQGFSSVQEGEYWSSSSSASNASTAFFVGMTVGYVSHLDKSKYAYAWSVRGGQ